MKRLVAVLIAGGMTLMAASIDGKWSGEVQMRGRKAASADARKVEVMLNLKSEGDQLTGSVTGNARGRGKEVTIQDGRIEGEKFSFTTMQKTKDGENKILWSGSVEGDQLTGTRSRDGAKRSVEFTAKRAN